MCLLTVHFHRSSAMNSILYHLSALCSLMTSHGIIDLLSKLGWVYASLLFHDDVIKWKHFPRYWPFVRGIHRSPVNSPHKGQWRGALMFSLICVWINSWINNRKAGDLRRYQAHYDVIVMCAKLLLDPVSTGPLGTNVSKTAFKIQQW